MIEFTKEQKNEILFCTLYERLSESIVDDLCCYGSDDEAVDKIKSIKTDMIDSLYYNKVMEYPDMRMLNHAIMIRIDEEVQAFRESENTERGE